MSHNPRINPLNAPDLHALADKFKWNAEQVFGESSPLYYALSMRMIADPPLLNLASVIPSHQPAPNLFFSAVHYLVMQQDSHPLASFFPDLTPQPNTQD